MSLDCAMILNLERTEDRYWCAVGALSVLNFDVEGDRLIRFLNHDGQIYADVKSVHEAAIADGFEEFGEWQAGYRAEAAWFWSYRCALREIVQMDKTVLLLIDDYVPIHGWTYERFCRLINECRSYDHGFRIIQLHDSATASDWVNNTPFSSSLAMGLSGFTDYGVLINAEGAELVLKTMKEVPRASPECAYSILARKQSDPEIYQGLWHTLEPIVRGVYGFRSNWSAEGPPYPEPWEVK